MVCGVNEMKNLLDNDTIQIEITNYCIRQCSNCSRHVGHHQKPYFMTFEDFKNAVDSMVGFPKMTGIQGGEPLLHPEFEKFCKYISSKIDPRRLGLWTTLPKGYEHYREIIVNTFHHIFINNHTLSNIYHHPSLVAIQEVIKDKNSMWFCIDRCWAQQAWSAAINPKGAFFCEIAAAMSILYDEGEGWEVEPNWWWRIPKDYKEQMEQWCPRCGFAAPISRRSSLDDVDDVSVGVLESLKDKSPKIMKGKYVVSDLKIINNPQPLAAYKNFEYRSRIAKTYGMFLLHNEYAFLTPYLYKDFKV
jgi:hypothetical protein